MLWMGMEQVGCVICGNEVDKKSAVPRKLYGVSYYFDSAECAEVFDGSGSILRLRAFQD